MGKNVVCELSSLSSNVAVSSLKMLLILFSQGGSMVGGQIGSSCASTLFISQCESALMKEFLWIHADEETTSR